MVLLGVLPSSSFTGRASDGPRHIKLDNLAILGLTPAYENGKIGNS
jgi:hypothetical protein